MRRLSNESCKARCALSRDSDRVDGDSNHYLPHSHIDPASPICRGHLGDGGSISLGEIL
jgi:hypothetical protein